MQQVHSKGLIHRDLKPSNCIILDTSPPSVKLVDFGLACTVHGEYMTAEEQDGAGTPAYQAPEVLKKEACGLPSDVYSFGIIVWELLSGRIPYEGISLEEMKSAVIAGKRLPVRPTWNRDLVMMMISCWEPEGQRRPTFSALIARISALIAEVVSPMLLWWMQPDLLAGTSIGANAVNWSSLMDALVPMTIMAGHVGSTTNGGGVLGNMEEL
ncbi:hypothetical protein GUITHDRAFT_154940 [Guillardia theta CCMP2712]|uniref:Protein kinase domain-containing protein n=1 Tax=Guillardia theta (strain CCMP2712) TaxID=905079 RepID=L1IMY3_GUITC|nr:hypothetical protein GUITHDRAFT_154940 [Guillardia theta CCMP2712]EKX37641.1 hypothetical protein GUITHDRAFT_154940 [Guillardia theta CCMP2712]|eukprot:XP_005824621.1 hypothetical protein GUITHDRAFT_154940 [Guillardia theta CCMP2712]